MTQAAALAVLAIFALRPAPAQSPEAKRFEVASVRINRENIGGSLVRTPGGLIARNAEFSRLITMAFETREIDLSRVAEPLRSERFDIVAKASGRVSGDQYWEMLRALLEERLRLKYHRETRDTSLYALVVAKGRELGPKINRSADPACPVNPSATDFCGVQARLGWMNGERVPAARIAQELVAFAGRPVKDQTGLRPAPTIFNSPGLRINFGPLTARPSC